MPQAKIDAFFKPTTGSRPSDLSHPLSGDSFQPRKSSDGCVYNGDVKEIEVVGSDEKEHRNGSDAAGFSSNKLAAAEILAKKRRYAQYHLELGQSDFLLHSCSVCGLMYACGDEEDEKLHKTFHRNYYEGVQFKGWRDERVVFSLNSKDRILLVLDHDPPAQKHKVRQVLKIMEKELGYSEDQLLHKLCKVYLFISSHRIVGCLVAERIRTAHRVISGSLSCKGPDNNLSESVPSKKHRTDMDPTTRNPAIQFGGFSFKRDVIRKVCPTNNTKVDQLDSGAILCEEQALPAICGFRAIWVVPSQRRKRIAWQLLDAARKSFLSGQMLGPSECAFSPPTSAGRALASNYSNSNAFLIYRDDDV